MTLPAREDFRYQPFYCEENVWWLLQHPELASHERYALFITNALRQCPLWAQKVAPENDCVVWDYHAIVLARRDQMEAWDLDSRLGLPRPLGDYLAATFPAQAPVAPPFAPRFRLVPSGAFLANLCTDRSHMRGPDGWVQPPPPWSPPCAGGDATHNLMRFVDLDDPIAGEVMGLPELERRFGLERP